MDKLICDRFKAIRNEKNMTQKYFAESLGVKQSYISHVESGKRIPGRTVIKLLCLLYEINEKWLCNGEDEMCVQKPNGNHLKVVGTTSHQDIVAQFDNPKLAEQISQDLLFIEKNDAEKLDTIHTFIKGVMAGLTPTKKKIG
jgi:transcriptional regulator with XRE-family HTH domain